MRIAAAACLLIGCTHPVLPLPSPVPWASQASHFGPPAIAVSPELAAKLSSGLTVKIELRVASTTDAVRVGTCSIVYDLWRELYFVSGHTIRTVPALSEAVETCLDRPAFDGVRAAAIEGRRPFSGIVVTKQVEPIAFGPTSGHDAIWCGVTTMTNARQR
jgi:hypothetical protein